MAILMVMVSNPKSKIDIIDVLIAEKLKIFIIEPERKVDYYSYSSTSLVRASVRGPSVVCGFQWQNFPSY